MFGSEGNRRGAINLSRAALEARSTLLGKSMRRVTRVTPLILSADVRD